jgi:VanZ family protein
VTEARPLAQRLAVLIWRLGFFVPLLICTYLALVPEPPDNPVFRVSDVLLHAAAFSYLTFAFVLMDQGVQLNRALAIRAALIMLGYGIFLEGVQWFVPQRSAELKDLGVDLLGILVGLLLAMLLARPVKKLLNLLLGGLLGGLPGGR